MAVDQKMRMSALSGKIRMRSLGHRSTYPQNSLKCPMWSESSIDEPVPNVCN